MFKSFAQWPEGTCDFSNNISEDKHQTRSAAQSVCTALERDGFGGDGKIFPVKTWVE
jgi:hypothetical protein